VVVLVCDPNKPQQKEAQVERYTVLTYNSSLAFAGVKKEREGEKQGLNGMRAQRYGRSEK
jgi:hypothetical protein